MPLVDNIDVVISADRYVPRPIKSWVGAFPLGHECSIGREFLYTLIPCVSHINVPARVDSDGTRFLELTQAFSLCSDDAKEHSGRRKLLNAAVSRVGNEHISGGVDGNSTRQIKLAFLGSLATFKHTTTNFRQGTKPGRRCLGDLVNCQ